MEVGTITDTSQTVTPLHDRGGFLLYNDFIRNNLMIDWSYLEEYGDRVVSLTSPSSLPTKQYLEVMGPVQSSKPAKQTIYEGCYRSRLSASIDYELKRFDSIRDHQDDQHNSRQTYRDLKTDSLRRIRSWIDEEIEQRLEEDDYIAMEDAITK